MKQLQWLLWVVPIFFISCSEKEEVQTLSKKEMQASEACVCPKIKIICPGDCGYLDLSFENTQCPGVRVKRQVSCVPGGITMELPCMTGDCGESCPNKILLADYEWDLTGPTSWTQTYHTPIFHEDGTTCCPNGFTVEYQIPDPQNPEAVFIFTCL